MARERVPDLESLALLLAVADEGSIGRAAAVAGLGQPAATARLRRAEGLLGVPLLVRGARGSQLTEPGRLVAAWARDVLAAADALDAGVAALRGERTGRLRVAASLTVAEHLLPRWLVALAAQQPGTTVSASAVNSEQVERAVLAGDADLGFVEGPHVDPALDSALVGRDHLVLVVPPGHRWTRRPAPVPATELAASRLVAREPSSGTRTSLEAALRAALGPDVPLAPPLLELSTTSSIVSAVAAGAGPAVLSHLAVVEDVRAGRLVVVPVGGLDPGRELRAVWPRGQRPSRPAGDLLTVALSVAVTGSRAGGDRRRPRPEEEPCASAEQS